MPTKTKRNGAKRAATRVGGNGARRVKRAPKLQFEDWSQQFREMMMRLDKDVENSTFSDREVRIGVDLYCQMQHYRCAAANQERSAIEHAPEEPRFLFEYVKQIHQMLEDQLKGWFTIWARRDPVANVIQHILGIGPTFAAGLAAHIDMDRTPCVSALWRFAGQDPTCVWKRGMKRPFNARLKVLCWRIGDSFVKQRNKALSFYGNYYAKWKQEYEKRNDNSEYVDQAAEKLKRPKNQRPLSAEWKACMKGGKLPPGIIDLRARRKTVKLFLSHYWDTAYRIHFDKEPPTPWVIEHGGHVDFIPASQMFAFERGEV